ncbi:MAG TPA: DAK2 domain-containing protein, partial [Chloroflexota bacterium]|nr:DAK2 domain-containing protein [Chloroflexota bacterium]
MRFRKGSRDQAPSPTAETHAADTPIDPRVLTSGALQRLIRGATDWLDRNAGPVNQLNVFPVPDGDTGTNMLLTMRAAVDGAAKARSDSAGDVMRAIAQGAVMGARGNSGVILSQIIAGLARGMEGAAEVDGATLARSLMEGATTAYRAVTRPVEGTILTVAREAGEGAMDVVETHAAPTCSQVLEAALRAASQAVDRTPEQLPILRQAGVVDAGGEGYRVVLEGMAFVLRGEPVPTGLSEGGPTHHHALAPAAVEHREAGQAIDASALRAEEWGYCTQFVIHGDALELERIRAELQDLAASALVVGDADFVRVHGHTEDPGQLLSYAVRFGRLQRISIEDMDAQHDAWLRDQVGEVAVVSAEDGADDGAASDAPAPEIATVAVSPGAGLTDVFKSLGATQVIAGGQTMNPSASDVLEAARRTRARSVLVLPNNGNVVMTAQQAARVAADEGMALVVVPTKTVPQGIAAQLAFDPTAGADANAAAMAAAVGGVRTVEVTRATRSVTLDGVEVCEGDFLGLVDDKVVTAGHDC